MKNKIISMFLVLILSITLLPITVTNVDAKTQTGKILTITSPEKKSIQLYVGDKFKIKTNYKWKKLKFSSSKKSVVTVSKKGKITAKKKGKAKITIKSKETSKRRKITVRVKYKPVESSAINKPFVATSKPTGLKVKIYTKKFTVGAPGNWTKVPYKWPKLSWKAVNGAEKYQIYRLGNASGEWIRIATTSKTSTLIGEAFEGKLIKLKIRAYKLVDGQKQYCQYSDILKYTPSKDYILSAKMVKDTSYGVTSYDNPNGLYRFLAEEAFILQNKLRTDKGVEPLIWSEKVYEVSKIRAKYMTYHFDHFGCMDTFNKVFNSPGFGYEYGISGENGASISLIHTFYVIDAWKRSEGHYKNLTDANYKYGAIAYYYNVGKNVVNQHGWVSNFAVSVEKKRDLGDM